MRKIGILVLVFCLISSIAFATTRDTRVSAGTVTFSSVIINGNNIVTFNSVTNHIRIVNLSPTSDCYVDLRCTDGDGKTGYITGDITNSSGKVLVPALGRVSPNAVELDFSTRNLGFVKNGSGSSSDKISYVVTGDQGAL